MSDDHAKVHERERAFHADRRSYERSRRLSALGYRGGVNSAKHHLLRAIEGFEGGSVLDLGCGEGWLSRAISDRFEIVISLDIVTEVLAPDLRGVCAAAEFLPFADDSFDAVVGSGVLHHAADLTKAMGEIDRVLKRGGGLAFAEPLRRHPLIATYRRLTPRARSIDERPFTWQELTDAFARFSDVYLMPLELTTVLAAPLNALPPLRSRFVPTLTKGLRCFDRHLLRRWPSVGQFAWCAVVTARSGKT